MILIRLIGVVPLVLLLSIGIQILGNTYLSKEFARVLGPGQIVTSLEHLGTVPGVQVTYR